MVSLCNHDPLGCGLSTYLSKKKHVDNVNNISFIQIGSCDLSQYDDFKHFYLTLFPDYSYSGLFIEPQEWAYKNLLKKIKNKDNFHCLNKAVGFEEGKRSFFQLKDDYIGRQEEHHWKWEEGMGSFVGSNKRNDEFLQSEQKKLKDNHRFEVIEVDVITLSQVFVHFFRSINSSFLNILFMDIEGLDCELLLRNSKIIGNVSPDVIFFERMHSSQEEVDKLKEVFSEEYCIVEGQKDICFLNDKFIGYKDITSSFQ